jgi:DNA-binding transcriptional MerR regulator
MLSLPQYVLRFWESKFKQIKPLKMKGGRRYYRPEDIETLATIKRLLYKEGYTIKGARKAFDDMRKGKKGRESVKAPPESRITNHDSRKKASPAPLLDAVRQSALTSLAESRKKQELESLRNELQALKKTLEVQ